jgi:phospholipid/cholesterol/gamma-HCH transport system substrate-binding protein
MNIYQPAQSAVTGILAPVNFANTVQFICSAIQAASRENWEQSSKLCVQYLAPIIKNRQYNFPPLGVNPFVGASARPNEITYSEDRLNPGLPPQAPPDVPAALNNPAEPLAAEAAIGDLPPEATPTDPSQGLQGLMVPGGTP